MEKKFPQAVTAITSVLQPPMLASSALMTPAEASAYIGIEAATLAVWRCTGRYSLPYLKVGRLVRYRKDDLDTFLESRRVGSVQETE